LIASVSPSAPIVCGSGFTLVIKGEGFTPQSVVQYSGRSVVPTSYVSPTELTVAISAVDFETAVTHMDEAVTVDNPAPPGTTPNGTIAYQFSYALSDSCSGNVVVIDANAQAITRIQKDLFGVNLTAAMDLTSSNANYSTILSTLRNANFGMLRWPLAGLSDYYHWQTNSFSSCAAAYGPVSRTTFDQFMQQVALPLGLDVNITINYGSNSDCSGGADPNEAAAWVDYANNQMHYGIKYWTIGNEQYYGSPTLGATFTTPDFNVSPSAPASTGSATYANLVATQFYPLMKAKDPTIQIGIDLAAPDNNSTSRSMSWDSTVLANAKFDFVEVHWYGASPPNVAISDTTLLAAPVFFSSYFERAIGQLDNELMLAGKTNTPIYVGEWGIPGPNGGSPQDITWVGALYTALALGQMASHGIAMAGVWEGFDSGPCVLSQPISGILTLQNWYTPSLFEAIAGGTNPACPSIVLPPIGTAFPRAIAINMVQQVFQAGDVVTAANGTWYGTRRSSGYGLLLVNTSPDSVATAVVITNDNRKFSASSLVYGEAQYDSSQSNNWAGPVSQSLGVVSGSFSLQLPGHSISAVSLSTTP
jgi:hypothetical protein